MSGDYQPDRERFVEMFASEKQSPATERVWAVYCAVLLIGQRTPEELCVLANYLETGNMPILR